MQLWASLRRTYFVHMSCSNVFPSKLFFFFFLSSKVRTRVEPKPNLPNPVLSVLVCGSPFCLPQVQFWFKVLRDTSENRTEPNFGIPSGARGPIIKRGKKMPRRPKQGSVTEIARMIRTPVVDRDNRGLDEVELCFTPSGPRAHVAKVARIRFVCTEDR